MAVNPYYVGSTLDTIGNNMSRDYSTDAQLRAAELQARNQFAQILQQAMQAQQNRQQQGGQFDQEMAFRNAALQQQGQLRGQELGQNQGQFDANLNYMREALKQQLEGQLKSTQLQFPPERWKVEDSRIAAERLQQDGLMKLAELKQKADQAKADAEYNSRAQLENDSLRALASQLNTVLKPTKLSADSKAKDGWGWAVRKPTDNSYRETYRSQVDPEISRLIQSIQGQAVRFNPATEEFEPVLAPLRGAQSAAPGAPGQNDLLAFAKDAISRGANPAAIQQELAKLLGAPITQSVTNQVLPPYPEQEYRSLLNGIGGSSNSVWPPLNQTPPLPPPQPRVMPINGLQPDPNQVNMQSLIQALNALRGQ